MPASKKDWSHFTLRIKVAESPGVLYNSCGTVSGMKKWFIEECTFFAPDGNMRDTDEHVQTGDTYEWKWFAGKFLCNGKVLEVDSGKSIKFSLCCDDEEFSFSFEEVNGETLVELNQYVLYTDSKKRREVYMYTLQAWTFFLANIKSIYEGGIDLRERNHDTDFLIN